MNDQIAPLDQFDAHLAGQESVFEIGRVVDAGGEQHDGRVCRPSGASERSVESSAWP